MTFRNLPNRGQAIRKFRESQGLSGKEFAERAGISAGHLSELEQGKRNLTEALLERIARAYGLSTEALTDQLQQFSAAPPAPPLSLMGTEMREHAAPYQASSALEQPLQDIRVLAVWLLERLELAEVHAMLREATESAIAGDRHAAARARALLVLIAEWPAS